MKFPENNNLEDDLKRFRKDHYFLSLWISLKVKLKLFILTKTKTR